MKQMGNTHDHPIGKSGKTSHSGSILQLDTINPRLAAAEYAIRGEIVIRANELKKQLEIQQGEMKHKENENKSTENKSTEHKLPFSEIIYCNIGNPQEVDQQPITFFRQVIALCQYPALMEDSNATKIFPSDAIQRAKQYLRSFKGMGVYTTSPGLPIVRNEVAKFIEERDGFHCDPEDIFLTDGASTAIKMILELIIRNEKDGVMIPIPQYPLYSATLKILGGAQVSYYLDESDNWSLSIEHLNSTLQQATLKGICVRALVVINPGNPTGQCLTVQNMEKIVDFCKENGIILLADEVYQTNVYSDIPFTSFKRVIRSLGDKYNSFELASFHSVSKGFLGECGQRGGYVELAGFDPFVKAQIYKLSSVNLCSNTSGQIMIGLMVNPPKEGNPSFALYKQERDKILLSLKTRAGKLVNEINKIKGIKCNAVQGALYAFPSITLPHRFILEAKQVHKSPDMYYALKLLENTGIVVVPGCGFGEKEGSYHFRITILPPESKLDDVIRFIRDFHFKLFSQYEGSNDSTIGYYDGILV